MVPAPTISLKLMSTLLPEAKGATIVAKTEDPAVVPFPLGSFHSVTLEMPVAAFPVPEKVKVRLFNCRLSPLVLSTLNCRITWLEEPAVTVWFAGELFP